MPEDLGKWGFLALVILIASPILFWIISLLIVWGKWVLTKDKVEKVDYAELSDFIGAVSDKAPLKFKLGVETDTVIKLVNEEFKEIKTVLNKRLNEGYHKMDVDVTQVPTGTYFFQLITANQRITKKVIISH